MVTARAGADVSPIASASGSVSPSRSHRRLFRKYLLLFIAVIGAAVVVSGALEIWYGYRDQIASQERLQEAQAAAAAETIEQFITEIENQLAWATHLPWSDPSLLDQRRLDALRLLRQVPAVSELTLVDPDGREQLRVSRLAMDIVASEADLSAEPSFAEAIGGGPFFGPVYYRRGSEPYMTIAVGGTRRDNGVAIAEVNLTFIWDLVSVMEVGETGIAYVVDGFGNLVAHPDISLVLRNTNLSEQSQVAEALQTGVIAEAKTVSGQGVIVAAAGIPVLGWVVLAELPIEEALVPIYRTLWRTGGLLALGVVIAVVAAVFFTRRLVGPVRVLEAGAAAIGSGDLSRRINVTTGDELESLADQFNDMAERLSEARSGLERRVAARTEELAAKTRELAAASDHKSQFLANMSHELRTPLNAILGFAELLLDGIYGPLGDKTRQVVERLKANGDHLLGLINDVLDLSKIEAGELTLALGPYDLAETIRSVVASVEPLASEKALQLEVDVASNLPKGIGDERRLRQVFLNVVGNAIKFTDVGSVRITARAAGDDEFVVSVSDTGSGISGDDTERVFAEFQQAGELVQSGGTGLGLSISRHITELHGGRIELASEIGRGSTFDVVFPITAPKADVEPA